MKPGSVNSAERVPPPIVSRASMTQTEQPSRASSMAAARPFGPDPTTTASKSIVVLYTRGRWLPLQRQSQQHRTMRDGLWPTDEDFAGAPAGRTGRERRNPRKRDSTNCSGDHADRVRSFAAPRSRAPQDTGRDSLEKLYSR